VIVIVIEQINHGLFLRTKEMVISGCDSLVSIINIYEPVSYQQAIRVKSLKENMFESLKKFI